MALNDKEISELLIKHNIKKDTYRFIEYSDEIKIKATEEFGNILNRSSIIKIVKDFKEDKKIKPSATLSKFINIIIEQLEYFKPIKILNELKGEVVTRYIATYTEVSQYEIALSLLSNSFLSHYSALYANNLTINNPKDIYINREQSKKKTPIPTR